MLPPDCADGSVDITLEAYLPSSTQEHCLVSAVFNITTNIKRFKKPITIRFPHWVNVKSEQDNKTLHFLICHNDSCEIKNGYFENEKSFGSINLSEFCLICICKDLVTAGFTFIKTYFQSSTPQIATSSTSSQNVITVTTLSNLEEGLITTESTTKTSDKKYLDLLILPEDCNEKWGIYCIALDNPTYLQAVINYLKNENWINIQVKILKRKVVFEDPTDDAVAEVYIVNKSVDGKIIKLLKDRKIPKQKLDNLDLSVSENVGNNNTLIVNNEEYEIYFPMCFLHITGKLSSSSSKLKVDGLCGIGQEPSEFSLAFPTKHGYKFKIYVHIKPQIITQTFDCFAVAQMLKTNLVSLSNLSYENIKIALYAKSVITSIEKNKIDNMISSTDQIVEVIEIVRKSLINEETSKYKCFLESMEQSDDKLLKETARKYGGSQSVPDLMSDS